MTSPLSAPQCCGLDMYLSWQPMPSIAVWRCSHRGGHPLVLDYATPDGWKRSYEDDEVSSDATEGCVRCAMMTRNRCQRCGTPLCTQCTGYPHARASGHIQTILCG